MSRQMTEMLEGTLEGIVVARLEERGFVDVERVASDTGPPRKVYSLNAQGQAYLEEFWRAWSFLAERIHQLREGGAQPCPSPRSPTS